MKKIIASIATISAVVLAAGAVQAQSITPAGNYTLGGNLSLQQTLPFPLACTVNNVPFTVHAAGNATTTAAVPYSLCTGLLGAGVRMLGNWTITATGGNNLLISGVHVQALSGTCGSATQTINATLTSPTQITIPQQQVPGVSNGNSVPCNLGGVAVSSGALTIVP